MADTTTPKLSAATALPGSTTEEAIDLVQEVCEVNEDAATGVEETEKKEKTSSSAQDSISPKFPSVLDLSAGVEEDNGNHRNAENEAGVAGSGDSTGRYESRLAEAAQGEEDARPSSPSMSDTASAALGADSAGCELPRLSTLSLPSESFSESLETPPGLEPPSSVTLLKPSATTKADEEVLPLETGLPGRTSFSSPNALSSFSLSQHDRESQSRSFQKRQPQYFEFPRYQHREYRQPSQPQRFEPLPPSQLLSATISHALSLTTPSQPRFTFQSHPQGQQHGPSFNFTYKPSSRDVISGIAPHVFDERRRRRSMSRVRRNSGKWLHRSSSGGFDGGYASGYGGRPRASPLRRSVAISWDERSIYLEEATHSGTITSRVSIDLPTGHERKISDSSSSSSSSGSSEASSCSPTSLPPPEKGTGKKLLGGASGKTGPRWSRKFKLFKNIVSKMKKRGTPAQAVAAH